MSGGVHGALCGPRLVRRLVIGEPLAFDAEQSAGGASSIINAKLDAIAIAEIELGEIAVQMPLVTMLVDASHPALEHREETLDRIGVHVAAHVFLGAVIDG